MRICHFCSSNFGGTYYSYLGNGLGRIKSEQFFVTLNLPDPPDWLTQSPEINYSTLGTGKRIMYPFAIRRLAQFLSENRIEILQTHMFEGALIGMIAARLARTPITIVTRHHLDEGMLLGTRVHLALERWSNQAADCVIVPSEATRRFMFEVEKQKGTNVRVIPYGFDFEAMGAAEADREKVRKEFGLSDDFVIGCVGRFFKNKGHVYLFEAVADIIKDFPNVKILLLGSGDREMLNEVISRLDIIDHVIFAGYRNDIPACMKAMDLLVHPSLSESFGQVIVEALCVGTPVVVTSVGGVPEIVSNGETGIVVEPKNSKALYDAILRMIKNPALRLQLGSAGRASVTEKFTVEKFIDLQWECYQDLLKAKNVG